ncbi:MAG: nucleotidyltransferase domain-containing protein [Euryarchaeota archaeon]|nr:nucleotidyltransferase domain-containing protein [Euryarchaeota archaeon]
MDNRKKALDEFVHQLRERYGERIERIILFGSYARGDYGVESDIDVLVVAKTRDLEMEREISGIAFDLLLKYSVDISPKVYSREEFERGRRLATPFMREVERYGEAVP